MNIRIDHHVKLPNFNNLKLRVKFLSFFLYYSELICILLVESSYSSEKPGNHENFTETSEESLKYTPKHGKIIKYSGKCKLSLLFAFVVLL